MERTFRSLGRTPKKIGFCRLQNGTTRRRRKKKIQGWRGVRAMVAVNMIVFCMLVFLLNIPALFAVVRVTLLSFLSSGHSLAPIRSRYPPLSFLHPRPSHNRRFLSNPLYLYTPVQLSASITLHHSRCHSTVAHRDFPGAHAEPNAVHTRYMYKRIIYKRGTVKRKKYKSIASRAHRRSWDGRLGQHLHWSRRVALRQIGGESAAHPHTISSSPGPDL